MGWDFVVALLKLIVLLPVVLFLAYVVIRYALPRLGGGAAIRGSHLCVVDRLVLSPKCSIVVIEAAGRYFLLAINDGRTSIITEMDSYPKIEPQEDVYLGLRDMLQKTREKFPGHHEGKGA